MSLPPRWEDTDDRELMRLHVAGDPEAFEELVHRHRDRLWAVALRTMGEPEEAADALQDALLSAFRRAESYRGEAAVTTWLHRVVINACMDRHRRRKVRQTEPLPSQEDRMAELGIEPQADPAEVLETRSTVLEALEQLSPEQRAAIVLVDMEGYSVQEAASILECAEGTVKSRCARGRTRLVPLLTALRAGNQPTGPNVSSTSLPTSRDRQGGATR